VTLDRSNLALVRNPFLRNLVLGLLLALLATGLVSVFLPYTVDDAFITFRYARNLSSGLGPVFNPGERAEGYTSFLWMLLLGGAYSLNLDLVVVSKIMGLVCLLATAGVIYWAASTISRHPRRVGVVAVFVLLTWVDVALNSVTGMETAFYMLWVTAAVTRHMWEERHGGVPWSSLLFGLAALTRPEGLALFGLHWLYRVAVARWRWRQALVDALPFLLLVGAHWLWQLNYYGDLLPATYYAKAGPLRERLLLGLWYVLGFTVAGGVFFLAGVPIALRQGNPRLRYPLWIASGGLAIALWEGGDWMVGYRFLVPVIPIWCLITAELLSTAYTQTAASVVGPRWQRLRKVLVVLLLSGAYLAVNAAKLAALRHYTTIRAMGYRTAHLRLAEWLSANYPSGTPVALMDIGIVGYYTDLRLIDITGLTDTTIAHAPGFHVNKVYDPAYVLDQEPEVIVLVSLDSDLEPDFPVDRRIYANERFQSEYVLHHTLDHYHDTRLGDYSLLVFRKIGLTLGRSFGPQWGWGRLAPGRHGLGFVNGAGRMAEERGRLVMEEERSSAYPECG
jgi:arabinofuranosyltransferase